MWTSPTTRFVGSLAANWATRVTPLAVTRMVCAIIGFHDAAVTFVVGFRPSALVCMWPLIHFSTFTLAVAGPGMIHYVVDESCFSQYAVCRPVPQSRLEWIGLADARVTSVYLLVLGWTNNMLTLFTPDPQQDITRGRQMVDDLFQGGFGAGGTHNAVLSSTEYLSQARSSFNNIEEGFYISPAFLDKMTIHIAKNFMVGLCAVCSPSCGVPAAATSSRCLLLPS